MCGIAGIVSLDGTPVPRLDAALDVLDRMIAHRGPDGDGAWTRLVAAPPGSLIAVWRSSI